MFPTLFVGTYAHFFACSPLRKNVKYDILERRIKYLQEDEIGGILWQQRAKRILRIKRLRDRTY